MTKSRMVVKALLLECQVAEMAMASRGLTMLLPLVVDKAGMVQCDEATTLLGAIKFKV